MKKTFFIGVLGFFSILLAQSSLQVPGLAGTGTRYGTWSSSGKAIALTLGSANQISGVNAAGTGIENKAVTVTSAGITDVSGNFSVATNKFTVASATGATVIAGAITGAATLALTAANSTLGIGTSAPTGDAIIQIDGGQSTLTGTTQYGVLQNNVFNATGTTAIHGLYGRIRTVNSAYTVTNAYTIRAVGSSKGAAAIITNLYGVYVDAVTQGGTLNHAIFTNAGLVSFGDATDATNSTTAAVKSAGGIAAAKDVAVGVNIRMGAEILISNTAPTISSGFGTSPSIASNNGTAAFTVNVGTGGTASTGVIGLPTATTGWICTCADITTFSVTVFLCRQTATATTTATIGQFSNAAVARAWAASDIVRVSCFAY